MKLAAVAIAALFIATNAGATPGRTNAKGCHNSKKAGYHCHGTQKRTPIQNPTPVAPPPKKKEATNAVPKVDKARPRAQDQPKQ